MTQTEYVRGDYWGSGSALDIYAIEDCDDSIDVKPAFINGILGYKESFWPQGFWRVSDDRPIERLVSQLDI